VIDGGLVVAAGDVVHRHLEAGLVSQLQFLGQGAVVPGVAIDLADELPAPLQDRVPRMQVMELLVDHDAVWLEQLVAFLEEAAEVEEMDDDLVGDDGIEGLVVLVVLPVADLHLGVDGRAGRYVRRRPAPGSATG